MDKPKCLLSVHARNCEAITNECFYCGFEESENKRRKELPLKKDGNVLLKKVGRNE